MQVPSSAMLSRTWRIANGIAHVVQAVKEANEIVTTRRIALRRVHVEGHALAESGLLCHLSRGFDRALVVIKAEKAGVRKRLRQQSRRYPTSATNVGDLRAALELFDHAIKRGQPFLHEMVLVAGAEEAGRAAEQAFAAPVPADALAALECVRDFRFVD